MIYVVTGYPRSGTSAMMQALRAGGLQVMFSPAREKPMLRRTGHSVLEMLPKDFTKLGFSREVPEGWAVKIPLDCIHKLAARPTTVIWMRRDALEVRASLMRTFPVEPTPDKEVANGDWPKFLSVLSDMQRGILLDRRSVVLHEVWYPDLTADPLNTLRQLELPIDVSASSLAVWPSRRAA